MERHPHTTDAQGFDYMANSGLEEKDREEFTRLKVIKRSTTK